MTITNTSNAPQDYYLDPRLDKTATLTLAPLSYSANQPFQAARHVGAAAPASAGQSLYFVPSADLVGHGAGRPRPCRR